MGCPAALSRFSLASAVPVVLILLVLLSLGGVQAQPASFEAEAAAFRSATGEGGRVDVYTRVPHAALRFVRRDAGFQARYSVTVTAYHADRNDRPRGVAATQTWEHTVPASNYAATQAEAAGDYAVAPLDLEAGRYVLNVEIADAASGRTASQRLLAEVPAFTSALAVSDLLLVERYDSRAGAVTPVVASAVPVEGPPLTLFYEVYARQPERLRVRYTVRRPGPERRRGPLGLLFGRGGRNETPPLVERAEWFSAEGGRTPAAFALRVDRFGTGDFVAEVRVERADGSVVAEREKAFSVRWTGLEEQLRDVDAAIAQLRYVAKDHEVRAMRAAPTPAERYRLFRAFWDKRDPTPDTPRNERMEEYYYRIAFADRNYGGAAARPGWSTDRGEVFIRFGEPDFVENRAGGQGSRPHQIWHYNRIGRRFLFVDESGRGEFRLLVPLWDERTRM